MRKLIAAINMSLDGYCDHTAMNADEEVHAIGDSRTNVTSWNDQGYP